MAEGLVLSEQRHLARRELIYYLKITDRKSGRELGRMGDLHGEGMLVLGEKPLKTGDIFHINLELPKALQSLGHLEIPLTCEAVWSRPGPKNSTYFESGVRFISPDAQQKTTISKLIDLFAMPGQ